MPNILEKPLVTSSEESNNPTSNEEVQELGKIGTNMDTSPAKTPELVSPESNNSDDTVCSCPSPTLQTDITDEKVISPDVMPYPLNTRKFRSIHRSESLSIKHTPKSLQLLQIAKQMDAKSSRSWPIVHDYSVDDMFSRSADNIDNAEIWPVRDTDTLLSDGNANTDVNMPEMRLLFKPGEVSENNGNFISFKEDDIQVSGKTTLNLDEQKIDNVVSGSSGYSSERKAEVPNVKADASKLCLPDLIKDIQVSPDLSPTYGSSDSLISDSRGHASGWGCTLSTESSSTPGDIVSNSYRNAGNVKEDEMDIGMITICTG